MLEEVFPHEEVQPILEKYFVVVHVDVDKEPEAASWFRTAGVPDL